MSTNDPAFWVMVVVAASFAVIAVVMVAIAVMVSRALKVVARLEERVAPLVERVGALSEQVRLVAGQGREVAEQISVMSGHLAVASKHFSESMSLVRQEVTELKQVVGYSAVTARDKVERISRHIDRTHDQLEATTLFIQSKLVSPARELAAIMAGVRRTLEVLVAPTPKPINQTYGDDEMFIG